MKQHLRNFIALGVGNYAAMGVSMVINAILTRRLGADQFGRLALLLTTSQVLALVASNWTQSAVVRFGALEFKAHGSVSETLWTRLWIAAPWAMTPALAAFVAGGHLATYLGIPTWGLAIVWLHFAATMALSTVGALFQARQEMARYGTVLFFDKAIMAVLVVVLPRPLVHDPLTILALYAGSSTLVAVGAVAVLGVRRLLPIAFSRSAYRAMWVFASPLILSNWASLFGTSWFDLIIIKAHRAAADLGWYSLGTLLAGVLQQVAIISSTLVLPQFSVSIAQGEFDRIRMLSQRVLPYWFLATSALFSAAAIAGAVVVPLVFGESFRPSASVFAILTMAASALALFSIFSSLLSALGSTWALTAICFASGAVNVGMDLVLIPPYGIAGAAISTVLAYATSAALAMAFVQKRLQMPVMSLSLLSVPVVATAVVFLTLDGAAFYVTAVAVDAIALFVLVRMFGLFGQQDAVLLKTLNPMALWGTR